MSSSSSTANRQVGDNPTTPTVPPAYSPIIIEDSDITEEQLLTVLRSSKRSGSFCCLLQEKKDIIESLCKNKDVIAIYLKSVDRDNKSQQQDSTYTLIFNSIFKDVTAQSIKRANNVSLSDMFCKIYSILHAVHQHPRFRSGKEYVSRFMDKMNQLVDYIKTDSANKIEGNKLLTGLKLTKDQLSRKYMKNGGTFPRDDALVKCAFCQHPSVDEPPENSTVTTVNEERMTKHRSLVEEWVKYKDGKGPCPKTNTGKEFTRIPPPPKTESLILQCHCHQMTCARKNSNVGSTCAILCTQVDGNRYGWGDVACECIVCKCECKKAYKMEDIARIGIELVRKERDGKGKELINEFQKQ